MNTPSTWTALQDRPFSRATARERATGLADENGFRELLGPRDRLVSPHLPALGELAQFDDGMTTGLGRLGERPVFLVSMEGGFFGGGIGEVNGAKMFMTLRLAVETARRLESAPGGPPPPGRRPAVVISFDTGGVRLHEANAGLLAHAEIMDALQDARGHVPVIALCGGRIGAFGGMGFVTMATDAVLMNEQGRIGLTGPEVIEQEMGREEFDAADKALVWRTTGAKHRYIMRDCDVLVDDTIGAFRRAVLETLALPPAQLAAWRKTGSAALVQREQRRLDAAMRHGIRDATDLWRLYGNEEPAALSEWTLDRFLASVRRAPPE